MLFHTSCTGITVVKRLFIIEGTKSKEDILSITRSGLSKVDVVRVNLKVLFMDQFA